MSIPETATSSPSEDTSFVTVSDHQTGSTPGSKSSHTATLSSSLATGSQPQVTGSPVTSSRIIQSSDIGSGLVISQSTASKSTDSHSMITGSPVTSSRVSQSSDIGSGLVVPQSTDSPSQVTSAQSIQPSSPSVAQTVTACEGDVCSEVVITLTTFVPANGATTTKTTVIDGHTVTVTVPVEPMVTSVVVETVSATLTTKASPNVPFTTVVTVISGKTTTLVVPQATESAVVSGGAQSSTAGGSGNAVEESIGASGTVNAPDTVKIATFETGQHETQFAGHPAILPSGQHGVQSDIGLGAEVTKPMPTRSGSAQSQSGASVTYSVSSGSESGTQSPSFASSSSSAQSLIQTVAPPPQANSASDAKPVALLLLLPFLALV